jgi:hypothetical protein
MEETSANKVRQTDSPHTVLGGFQKSKNKGKELAFNPHSNKKDDAKLFQLGNS